MVPYYLDYELWMSALRANPPPPPIDLVDLTNGSDN